MTTYAIGDIQGCYDSLMKLLEKIDFNEHEDRLWFVGDLVNRGPHSLKVLRFVKSLTQSIIVLGNHDLHLLAVAFGAQVMQPTDTIQDILEAEEREELLDWLRKQKFLYYDEQLNIVMTHAGIYPKWTLQEAKEHALELEKLFVSEDYFQFLNKMYGNEPDSWNESLTREERHRFFVNAFTRMRYCDQGGKLNLVQKGKPDAISSDLYPWFDMPNRIPINAKIIFGHWAALGGKTNQEALFAIDTGCVWGKNLTAFSLEDQLRFQVSAMDKKKRA